MNVIGILHATRALDSECFVFTSRYDDTESYKTVGVHLGLMNYLSNVKWIARDMIWVFTDESQPFSSGIDYWLHDYLFGHDNLHILSPSRVFAVNSTRFESVTSSVRSETTPSSFGSLLRSGRLFGAIALHRVDYDIDFHRFIVFPEGFGGILPNLDIVNTITTTAYIQDTSPFASAGHTSWVAEEPIHGGISEMLSFLWNTALSFPRATHSFFSKYGVNSVTVSTRDRLNFWKAQHLLYGEISAMESFNESLSHEQQISNILRISKLLEVVIRNLHNADELLHQSYRWYTMIGITDFLDTGHAIVPYIVHSIGNFAWVYFLHSNRIHNSLGATVIGAMIRLFAKIMSASPLVVLPFLFPPHFSFPSYPSQSEHLSSLFGESDCAVWMIFLVSVAACVLLYFVIFRPIASWMTVDLITLSWPSLPPHSHVIASLLYLQAILLMVMCFNLQFGYLFLICTLPFVWLPSLTSASPNRSNLLRIILTTCYLLIANPSLLFVNYWGLSSMGANKWILILLNSYWHWNSFLWPFITLVWLPVVLTLTKVIVIK